MISDANQLPNDWKCVRLGDYVKKVGSGITHSGGESVYLKSGIPLIQSQNVHINRFEMSGLAFISPQQDEEMKDTRVLPGDVLLNITGASIGRVCVVPRKLCPANVNQHVCIIRTNGKINPVFLSLFISTPDFQRFIADNQSGATRQALTKSQIEDFQIPLPPLAEQKRIAAILEKCDRLRRTRRYALQLSDTFLQSVFLEMFGDPVTNPGGWEVIQLDDVCAKITDGTHHMPATLENGIPILRVLNIKNGSIDISDLKYIAKEEYEKIIKRSPLDFGDVLLTCLGTVGNTAIFNLKGKCTLVRNIAVLKPNYSKVSSEFLLWVLRTNHLQAQIQARTRQSSQGALYLSEIQQLKIVLPPLPLQEKFAEIVQKFERFRTQQRQAERQAEHLFQTLLHRAFRGELTSSDFNNEAVSVLSEEIRVQQTKPKSTGDTAEYLRTKAKPQDMDAVQLTLPGLE